MFSIIAHNFLEKNRGIFAFSILLAFCSALLNQYLWIFVLAIAVIIGITILGRDYIIPLTIILYLSFTGEYLLPFRGFLALALILILLYLFFQRFSFNFSIYPKLPLPFICFVIIYYLSLILSFLYNGYNNDSLLALLRVLYFSALFYILYSFIDGGKAIKKLLSAIILSSSIVSIFVFYEFIQSNFQDYLIGGILYRYAGLYANPNDAALLFTVAILLSFASLSINKEKISKTIIKISIILNFWALVLTNSRASLMALLISLFIYTFINNRKIFYYLIGVLALIGIIIFITPLIDFLTIYMRLGTLQQRDVFWNAGVEIFIANIFFGIGPDSFPHYFPTFIPSSHFFLFTEDVYRFGKPNPHNLILYMASENGLLGFISVLLLFGIFVYMCIKIIRINKKQTESFILASTFFSIGISLFIRSFFEADGLLTYGYITKDLPFWVIFGLLIYLYKNSNRYKSGMIELE